MAVSKSNLKFYLTGALPGTQPDPSLSIGGYQSTTQIALSSAISSALSQTSTSIAFVSAFSATTVLLDSELLNLSGTTITSRGLYGTVNTPHAQSSLAYAVVSNNLFNNSFNEDLKQHRCIAVKNTSSADTFFDLEFYIKKASQHAQSVIKMGFEVPTTLAVSVTAFVAAGKVGNTLSVVGTGLAGLYQDNRFKGCPLTFVSGPNVNVQSIVASYDGPSGTFTLTTTLPANVTNTDAFVVESSPSQVLQSGTASPVLGNGFSSAFGLDNAIGGVDLGPNEVVYLWFERTLSMNADPFINNSVIFTVNYKTS